MNQLTESSGKTLVVIPAHNEAQSVSDVIASIGQHVVLPIVVVDDASTDDTALVAAESGATVIPLINRLGAWGATQTGIRYALANRFTTVVTMDADGQHDPSFIMEMLFACESESADVCIGSWPLRGSALRKLAWGILRAVSGLKTTDLTSGYRVYNER
ncbi:MAG: glycosyltransferase family 2 protein, partial [Pseudomonadota bacterium]